MSYGAPCEQGVSAADTMPLRDREVPGLVPDVSEVKLALKGAWWGHQRNRRQQRWKDMASCRERSQRLGDPGPMWVASIKMRFVS